MNTEAHGAYAKSNSRLARRTGGIPGIAKASLGQLQEIRWVLKDSARMELPPPAKKTIDAEGRLVKDGVRNAIRERQIVLTDLVHAIREYRKLADQKPLTLQGSDYAHAIQELNKVVDRAERLLLR